MPLDCLLVPPALDSTLLSWILASWFWAGFDPPELDSNLLGLRGLNYDLLGHPGMDSGILGRSQLDSGLLGYPGLDSTLLGWILVSWGFLARF